MAIALTPVVSAQVPADLSTYDVLTAAGKGIIVGLVLGWTTALFLETIEMAGTIVDIMSGISIATLFDPASGNQVSLFARLARYTMIASIFATGSYYSIITGFVRTFEAVPLIHSGSISFDSKGVVNAIGLIFIGALSLTAPLVGALFLTEVVLALASRFAPSLNVLSMSLPAKTLIALTLAGVTFSVIPAHVGRLLADAQQLIRLLKAG